MRRHQPARLVVTEQPRPLAPRQRLAVNRDAVGRRDVERGRGNHRAIDGDAPGGDPGFRLAPRGKSGAGHHLGDALAGVLLIALVGHAGFLVMAGHSRLKDGVASLAYVPAIHALLADRV